MKNLIGKNKWMTVITLVLAFTLLSNVGCKKSEAIQQQAEDVTLTVVVMEGINGAPAAGTYTYSKDTLISYSYNLKNGYQNLQVLVDGGAAATSGNLTMSNDRTLIVTAEKSNNNNNNNNNNTDNAAKFVGNWKNDNQNYFGIIEMDIRKTATRIYVRMWGNFNPNKWDWGEVYTTVADADDKEIKIQYHFSERDEYITLELLNNNRIKMSQFSDYFWDQDRDMPTQFFSK